MNQLKNQVTLIGNLGQDVEVKTFASQRTVAHVSLATNLYYKNSQGEKVQETQWHNLVIWGKLGENLSKIATKGDEIMVQGRLTYRSYEDASGKKHTITEIVVSEFLKMTKKEQAVAA